MQALKQVIISRIHDIKQLEQSGEQGQGLIHQLILQQRNGQQYRNNQQIQILALLTLQPRPYEGEVEAAVTDIVGHYDPGLLGDASGCAGEARDRIFVILKTLFIKNGYRDKIGYLKSILDRTHGPLSAPLLLTMLSDWSKQKYLSILSSQIKQIKSRYLPGHPSIEKLPRMESLFGKNNPNRLSPKKSVSMINPAPSADTQRAGKMSLGNCSVGSVNSSKLLTIYNRYTLYGYITEELEQYYGLTGLELDLAYLRAIPKRKMKEHLPLTQNLNRAAEVLIECTANKELRANIRDYAEKHGIYREQLQKQKVKRMELKNSQSKNKSVRTMSDHLSSSLVRESQEKKFSVDMQKLNTQSGRTIELENKMNSCLLSPDSHNQELLGIKESIRKKIMEREMENYSKHENGSRVRFPALTRSMEKKEKTVAEPTKIYRFPTHEQNCSDKQQQQEYKSSLFKFSQQQTIKGIIIKNFLSNRQRQKASKTKQNQIEYLFVKNKQEYKVRVEEERREVDMRSLRKKTKALLKNFKTIQNY